MLVDCAPSDAVKMNSDPSLSWPVFFDCEASSLDGYIIEIGWAFVAMDSGEIASAAHLVRPAPDWKIRDAWSAKSERLHGISLAHLREHGRRVEEIARIMNGELAGRELFSDACSYDERWLRQVFDAAGVEPSFTIRRTDARLLLEQAAADRDFDQARLHQAREKAEQNRRHRAEADALIWAELWRMVMQRP
jgi:DNA polymerase III epsilon subunit-like protein